MSDLSRTLTVWADGDILPFRRARLTGRDSIGLFPMPFTLEAWNLDEDAFLRLSRASRIRVERGGSVLAEGRVTEVYRRTVPEGTVTRAVFSAGIDLWEAPVSLSVEAGATVSETVRRILEASGTGVSLLSFPEEDPVRSRGQAFFGRAAECVETALSALPARCCLVPSGLCVIPPSGPPVSVFLTEKDLIDAPSFTPSGHLVLRTTVTGWPLGKGVSVRWNGMTAEGIITERSVDADTQEGAWEAEIVIRNS